MRKLLMLAIIFVISLSTVAIFSQTTFAEEESSGANTSGGVVVQSIPGPTLAQKISSVVFDKGAFKFHGRVKALADGAKEAGLKI